MGREGLRNGGGVTGDDRRAGEEGGEIDPRPGREQDEQRWARHQNWNWNWSNGRPHHLSFIDPGVQGGSITLKRCVVT